MKTNRVTIKGKLRKVFLILGLANVLFLSSCRNEDPIVIEPVQPKSYDVSTNFYTSVFPFQEASVTKIRTDAVGIWKDSNNNIVLEIKRYYKNPNYPVESSYPWESEYVYDIKSTLSEFPISTYTKTNEISINGNNINLDNKFHLVVEGSNAWLWVMTDQPYVIRLWRNLKGQTR